MKLNRRSLEANLPKKGFRRDSSGHHIYFHHECQGRETGAYTKVSHSKKMKEISGGLLTAVKGQLKLQSNKQVHDLVECPMSGEEYIKILFDEGFIPSDD
jgi:hypothetical protein